MLSRLIFTVACLAVLAAANARPPQPVIQFKVNPNKKLPALKPTCMPLVQNPTVAFMCYMDRSGNGYVSAVDPSVPNGDFTTGTYKLPVAGYPFDQTPIPLGFDEALVDVGNADYSAWSLISKRYVQAFNNRAGSTARIAYSYAEQLAFIPFGALGKNVRQDTLQAYEIDTFNQKNTMVWEHNFTLSIHVSGHTALRTPIPYQGYVYVMQSNTLYVLRQAKANATAGQSQLYRSVANPCGIIPAAGQYIHMSVVTFGFDENGSLDAFIFYANTTKGFAFCRMSHHSFTSEWPSKFVTLPYPLKVLKVEGGANTVFLAGVDARSGAHEIHAHNIKTGGRMWVLPRAATDARNIPSVVDGNVVPGSYCNGTMFLQVNGKTSARCLNDAYNVLWETTLPCEFGAVYGSQDWLVCADADNTVHMINAYTGTLSWMAPIAVAMQPQFASSYIWVVDTDSVLYGLTLDGMPVPPGPNGPPGEKDEGLSGGAVAAILICVLIGIAGIAGAVYTYTQREARRRQYRASLDESGGYGSLT